jgi:assimilatory nitrate reductase catalytic subunit
VRTGEAPSEPRFFGAGQFFTSDRRGHFVAPKPPRPHVATSAQFPLRLNTGRVRDQWHTMTRTGKSPRLGSHSPEPCVEIHPTDAEAAKLKDGGFARVITNQGSAILKVAVRSSQRRGSIFAPIHWSDATSARVRIGETALAANDPYSGQPELKAAPARIAPVAFAYRGFALTRGAMTPPPDTWFARVVVAGGAGLLFATNAALEVWHDLVHEAASDGAELAEYVDQPRGLARFAAFSSGRLDACIFVGPADSPPQWDAVRTLFESDLLAERDRRVLLSGRTSDGLAETGPLICSCFGVGLAAIRNAVMAGGAKSAADIGRTLRAGTNCGSCLPELRSIVERMMEPA